MSRSSPRIYDVVLAHGPDDQDLAAVIKEAFAGRHLEVFAVQGLRSDDAFWTGLREALAECHAFVVLVTRSTLHWPDLPVAVGAAMGWNKPIYVLFSGVAKSELSAALRKFRALPVAKVADAVREINRSRQPLTDEQRQALVTIYQEVAVPAGRLLSAREAVQDLTEKYNRGLKANTPSEKLLQELIRMDKQRRLPKLQAQRRRSA
jgi:hypothetical protein